MESFETLIIRLIRNQKIPRVIFLRMRFADNKFAIFIAT